MVKTAWTGQMPLALFPDQNGNMGKLETAFWQFHNEHPRVYSLLLLYALQWRKRRGPDAKLGIKALFERVRWEINLKENTDAFKLNNNNTAFYARLLMNRNPYLKDMFSVRRQKIQSTIGPANDTLPSGKQEA